MKTIRTHLFDIEDAQKYGIEKAILLYNLKFWLEKNKASEKNIFEHKDGKKYYWTYNSSTAFIKLFPYMKGKSISKWLLELEKDGVIISGIFNKHPYDRTKWYSIPSLFLANINIAPTEPCSTPTEPCSTPTEPCSTPTEPCSTPTEPPIPDVNTNISTDVIHIVRPQPKSPLRGDSVSSAGGIKKGGSRDLSEKEVGGSQDRGSRDLLEEKIDVAVAVPVEIIPDLLKDKNQHIRRIGLFTNFKGIVFKSKEHQGQVITRNVRSARALNSYTDEQILKTMSYLQQYANFKWGLETISKYIDEDLEELACKQLTSVNRIANSRISPETLQTVLNEK